MPSGRRVRLFRNDRSQTLRIRRGFELESDETFPDVDKALPPLDDTEL